MAGRPAEAQSGKHGKTPLAGLPAEARGGKRGERVGGSNSVVESQPSKLLVAGSIPVSRSRLRQTFAPLTASRQAVTSDPSRPVDRESVNTRTATEPASPKRRTREGGPM